MRWTILGSTGAIGSHLVDCLRKQGHTVYTPIRGDRSFYERSLGNVIYAIGLTADFRKRPYDTVNAHVSLLAEVLEKASFESLLYISSTRVYQHASNGAEDSAVPVFVKQPSDLYNLSKLMGESLCLQDERKSVRAVRLSNVVGGDDCESSNFLPSIIRDALKGHIVLHTTLNSAKDYIHIDDVTSLLMQIAMKGRERLYNVASGIQTSHADWINLLTSQTGCSVEVIKGAEEVRFAPIDISRIKAEFNFQPRSVLNNLVGALKGS